MAKHAKEHYKINLDALAKVDSALAAVPAKPKDYLGTREAIETLKSRILTLWKSGYNSAEIARMIEKAGLGASYGAIQAQVNNLLRDQRTVAS